MTFKRDLGLAKFSGVVVCSPRLGWAVVSYLDFTPIPLTLEHIGTNLLQTARFQKSSKGGSFLHKPNYKLKKFLSIF